MHEISCNLLINWMISIKYTLLFVYLTHSLWTKIHCSNYFSVHISQHIFDNFVHFGDISPHWNDQPTKIKNKNNQSFVFLQLAQYLYLISGLINYRTHHFYHKLRSMRNSKNYKTCANLKKSSWQRDLFLDLVIIWHNKSHFYKIRI